MADEPADEWLEADGLGGFAMGTTDLVRTRRYHALLCAATTPPTGRVVLVAGLDATLRRGDRSWPLSAQRYLPGVVAPRGDRLVAAFAAEPWPTWEFAPPDGPRVRFELCVPRGAAAVALRWQLVDAAADAADLTLEVRPFVTARDHHALLRERTAPAFGQVARGAGADAEVVWQLGADAPAVVARADGDYRQAPLWYRDFLLAEEHARGFDAVEDLWAPGLFTFDLARGPAHLTLAADALPAAVGAALWRRERRRRAAYAAPLERAADAYVVARGDGSTLVAGYPWFTDWGRDTFLAMRGLLLATGRRDVARDVLCEWAGHVDGGMLPNRFADHGAAAEYHSVDAALWYVVATDEYLRGGDVAAADRERLHAAILAIVAGYAAGARHGVAMADDGLLRAGVPGLQLTWMDAVVDGRVVTPRIGKPVELQALWANALLVAGRLEPRWLEVLGRARAAFAARFWNAARGCLHDVVDVDHEPGRADPTLRPNQVLALGGLPLALLDGARARAALGVVERELLTPLGLRSLGRDEPGYVARYEGPPAARDAAYHNGTVWPWLLGPFVEAWLRLRGGGAAAVATARRRFLLPLLGHLQRAGRGHVSEIADAEAPFTPRGCPFQAWSVGELLRLQRVVLAGAVGRQQRPEPSIPTATNPN